jgi:uncharacterized protein YndB with AHSA1/START domain
MGKRAELDWTIVVDKSADEVFDYLVDIDRHHEWSTGDFRVEDVSERPLAVGTTWTSYGFQPPKEQDHRNEVTVTELVRPSRFAFTALDGGEEYRTTYVLTPEGAGTKVERHMDIPKPGGAAGLAFGGVVKAFIKPGVQKTLETFKANVEG